jgi:hypothetical protein
MPEERPYIELMIEPYEADKGVWLVGSNLPTTDKRYEVLIRNLVAGLTEASQAL